MKGDSGAPLFCFNDGQPVIVGIASKYVPVELQFPGLKIETFDVFVDLR